MESLVENEYWKSISYPSLTAGGCWEVQLKGADLRTCIGSEAFFLVHQFLQNSVQ